MSETLDAGPADVATRENTTKLLLALICFVPVITGMLSWNVAGEYTVFQAMVRHFSLPALVLELCVIVTALINGGRISTMLGKMHRWQQLVFGVLAVVMIAAAAMATAAPDQARLGTLIWFLHFLFFASLVQLALDFDDGVWRWLWKTLAVATLVYWALLTIFISMVQDWSSFDWVIGLPGYTNVRHTGYFIAPTIAGVCGLYVSEKVDRERHICWMLMILIMTFGLWSGTRGIFFAVGGALLVSLIIMFEARSVKSFVGIFSALIIAVIISLFLPLPDFHFGMFSRFLATEYSSANAFSAGRVELWQQAVPYILETPFIGHGADQYRYHVSHFGMPLNHPHNFILQILFQWGAIGAMAFFSLLLSIWVLALRVASRVGIAAAPAFMVLNTLLAYSMIDGTGNYPLPLMLMALAGANLICLRNQNSDQPIAV